MREPDIDDTDRRELEARDAEQRFDLEDRDRMDEMADGDGVWWHTTASEAA